MIEEWRDIKGFEEFYEISNQGRVRSKDRYYFQPGFGWRSKKGRVLSPNHNGNGYVCVDLRKDDGKRNRRYIHRLVAETFLDNPNGLPQVDHIDYDRRNNSVENLRWVTVSENAFHSVCNHPKTRRCFSKTGYKYTYIRNGKYRINIPMKADKTFNTLSDALAWRNKFAKENNIELKDNN